MTLDSITRSFASAEPTQAVSADAILPGATLGIVGGGQLGRMFAIAARQMGYKIFVWSDEQASPAAGCADQVLVASYEDMDAGKTFFQSVAALTFETENLPINLFHEAAKHVPVRPSVDFLYMSQNRVREKTGLEAAGLPVGPFRVVRCFADLEQAIKQLGHPAILKTASGGYDGKGQVLIRSDTSLEWAWQQLNTSEAVLEAFVPFVDEVSVVAARDINGQCVTYGPIHNTHQNHILDVSHCPAKMPEHVKQLAIEITTRIAESFHVIGVFCVELFVLEDGQVWINEIAPRPHNSGHLTIEGHVTSQFQQQVLCLCGLHVGSSQLLGPVAMANLLGDLWQVATPNIECLAAAYPHVRWHLYGKNDPRIGRKMGHLTALGQNTDQAVQAVIAAREILGQSTME